MIFILMQWQVETSTQKECSNWLKLLRNFSIALFCSVQKSVVTLVIGYSFLQWLKTFKKIWTKLTGILNVKSLKMPYQKFQAFQCLLKLILLFNIFWLI